MYEVFEMLSKDLILARTTEYEIIQHYCKGAPLNVLIRSPIRQDKSPSCKFYYANNGRIYLKDFSTGLHIDVFDVVRTMYNLSFKEALKRIYIDMGLSKLKDVQPKSVTFKEKHKKIIDIQAKVFNDFDLGYWESFGITKPILSRFNVYACKAVWINGSIVYTYDYRDPAYAYVFGPDDIKIYFPLRIKSTKPRFLTNSTVIQGLNYLENFGDLLINTKSYKDVMTLYAFGINAIAPQSESSAYHGDIIHMLKRRFNPIISLYDFDYAGISGANALHSLHGINRVFLTNGRFNTHNYGAKDISDYRRNFGEEATWKLINKFLLSYV